MPEPSRGEGRGRSPFRGLALVFVLTFVNLVGLVLVLTAVGLGDWTRWQFVALFGLIETAAGLSNILAPNIWRLPVAEATTSRRTHIRLAASTLLLPHWGGAGRAAAGAFLLAVGAVQEGVSSETLLLLPLIAGLTILFLGVSAAAARWGVAYPDTDTVHVTVRWRSKDRPLQPLSISASVQQFLLGVLTLPAVKTLQPGVLFGPELRPSGEVLVIALAGAALSLIATAVLWAGRLQWRAPLEQQRDAEQNA